MNNSIEILWQYMRNNVDILDIQSKIIRNSLHTKNEELSCLDLSDLPQPLFDK